MMELPASITSSITADEIRNAVLIAIGFVTVIGLAELWRRTKQPPVEWTRKLVHFGGGGLCLALPLLIHSFWIVLALAIGMCGIFIVSKKHRWLQSIHGVERASQGTEFYPIVILLLFVLTADQYWQFVICVLVLAVSDSAAALIGTRFGKYRFTVEEEQKSMEGSLAFFVVTFLVVLVPLLIWQPLNDSMAANSTALTHYFLTACLLGLLVTCMEIVSLHGADNLWVPLGTWLVLTKTFQTDVLDLMFQNGSFVAILICLLVVWNASNFLNVGGALVCCLAAYGLWAMGSLDWAIVFFIAFTFYITIAWWVKTPWQIRVRAATYSLVPPMLVLALANVLLNNNRMDLYHQLFGAFLAASCVSLGQAISNLASWKFRKKQTARYAIAMVATLAVTLTVVLISMFRQDCFGWVSLLLLCLISCSIVVGSAKLFPTLPPGDAPKRWLRIRAGLSIFAAVAVLILQQIGLCLRWLPQ